MPAPLSGYRCNRAASARGRACRGCSRLCAGSPARCPLSPSCPAPEALLRRFESFRWRRSATSDLSEQVAHGDETADQEDHEKGKKKAEILLDEGPDRLAELVEQP